MTTEEQITIRFAEQALQQYARNGFIPCYQVVDVLDRIKALKSNESKGGSE